MSLDIYGLTRHRDRETINRFLDEYVDRAASEDRDGEEIGLLPLNPELEGEELQWEHAVTLTHIVERGLDYPRRAFTSYLTSRRADIEQAILSFTSDDQLVLGFSVYSGDFNDDEAMTKALLLGIVREFSCHLGVVLLHTPPPSNESEFRSAPDNLPVVHFEAFDANWGGFSR